MALGHQRDDRMQPKNYYLIILSEFLRKSNDNIPLSVSTNLFGACLRHDTLSESKRSRTKRVSAVYVIQ
jgi:hypothetical protein